MTSSLFQPRALAGKHAFVAGGTSGINYAIAERFAAAGANVVLLGRDLDKGRAAAERLNQRFGWPAEKGGTEAHDPALAVAADVRDASAVQQAFAQAVAAFGPIDIIVSGAAGNFPAPALGLSSNGFRAVVDIDLLGTFHVCRFGFEHLKKPGACVLNISAPQAYLPAVMQAHVCAAKAGVDQLTRTLALEWGPLGVRVNALTPGAVDGTEGMARLAPTPEIKQAMEARLPLQRFASLFEIAEAALFLCSPAAAYCTGSVVVIDGGLSLVGFPPAPSM